MVKTTLEIKDELYKKLVEASLKKYGNTKNISRITNEFIEEHLKEKHKTTNEADEIEKRLKIAKETAGTWKIKETGAEYVRKIRDESEKRRKRLGL